MSAKENAVIIAGEPRIDFLPPEIRQKKAGRRTIRSLAMLLAAVLALCVVAYAGVTTLAVTAQASLSTEQDRTQQLLREQAQYSEVRSLQQTLDSTKQARVVASGNEIMWKPLMERVESTIPANLGIMQVTIDSYAVGETPPVLEDLQLPYQASIEMMVLFDTVDTVAVWSDALLALPEVSNIAFGGVVLNDAGLYESIIVIHVDESVFERRYFETERVEEEEASE
jgi:hypothetical protein